MLYSLFEETVPKVLDNADNFVFYELVNYSSYSKIFYKIFQMDVLIKYNYIISVSIFPKYVRFE